LQNEIGESQQGYAGETRRVKIKYNQEQSSCPKTFILKFSSQNSMTKGFLNELKMYHREVYFYKNFANDFPSPLAKCYFSEIDGPSGKKIKINFK
jgi:hypothetical protein